MGIGNPVHLIFLGAIALVVLGPKRLPELARSLGNGIREFRESLDAAASGEQPVAPMAVAQEPQPQLQQPQLQQAEPQQVGPQQAQPGVEHAQPQQVQIAATAHPVDPAQPVLSGDAPDRSPL